MHTVYLSKLQAAMQNTDTSFQIFSARLFRNYDQTSLYLPHVSLILFRIAIIYWNMKFQSDDYNYFSVCIQREIIKMKNIFLT